MDLDFSEQVKVKVSMVDYPKGEIYNLSESVIWTSASTTAALLFDVQYYCNKIKE